MENELEKKIKDKLNESEEEEFMNIAYEWVI